MRLTMLEIGKNRLSWTLLTRVNLMILEPRSEIDIKNLYSKFLDIGPRNNFAKTQSWKPSGFDVTLPPLA